MARLARASFIRTSRISKIYAPWDSPAMIRAKKLLSGLECSAITAPGCGGSHGYSEQPNNAMTAAKMKVKNRIEK